MSEGERAIVSCGRQARERPIDLRSRVRVYVFQVAAELLEDRLGSLEIADNAERLAHLHDEDGSRGRVLGLGERTLAQGQRVLEPAERTVGVRKSGVQIGEDIRLHERVLQRPFEVPDRLAHASPAGEGHRECRLRPRDELALTLPLREGDEGMQVALHGLVARVEPKAQLGVREREVELFSSTELGAGLQIVQRDAKLAGDAADRLQGGVAFTRLDPRDLRGGQPRATQSALSKSLLDAETADAFSDCLFPANRSAPISRHSLRILGLVSG